MGWFEFVLTGLSRVLLVVVVIVVITVVGSVLFTLGDMVRMMAQGVLHQP